MQLKASKGVSCLSWLFPPLCAGFCGSEIGKLVFDAVLFRKFVYFSSLFFISGI